MGRKNVNGIQISTSLTKATACILSHIRRSAKHDQGLGVKAKKKKIVRNPEMKVSQHLFTLRRWYDDSDFHFTDQRNRRGSQPDRDTSN